MNIEFTLKPSANDRPTLSHNLTNAEHELLTVLMEECSEVSVIIGKILRHGLNNYNPDKPEDGTNRDILHRELGDVKSAMYLLSTLGVINDQVTTDNGSDKLRRIGKYLHHVGVRVRLS